VLKHQLQSEAQTRGFGLFGVAPAVPADAFAHFAAWLDAGYAGEMDYLHRHRNQRRHPNDVLDGVRSVVMLGMEYSGRGGGG
jgi:epoxyqueuosine reductase